MSKKKTEIFRARITVYPRPEILDPRGKAIEGAMGRLGFKGVTEVRAGKSFEVAVAAKGQPAAAKMFEEMAEKLLANAVMEDFTIEELGDEP